MGCSLTPSGNPHLETNGRDPRTRLGICNASALISTAIHIHRPAVATTKTACKRGHQDPAIFEDVYIYGVYAVGKNNAARMNECRGMPGLGLMGFEEKVEG